MIAVAPDRVGVAGILLSHDQIAVHRHGRLIRQAAGIDIEDATGRCCPPSES
jgi:hypothetical protein